MARVISEIDYSFNAVSLEGSLREISQNVTVPEADITAFADVYQVMLAGDKKNVVTELNGNMMQDDATAERLLIAAMGGGPKSTIFDLTGSGPGANDPEYQCTASGLSGALVQSVDLDIPVGDAGRYRATIQNSGSTTRAVA